MEIKLGVARSTHSPIANPLIFLPSHSHPFLAELTCIYFPQPFLVLKNQLLLKRSNCEITGSPRYMSLSHCSFRVSCLKLKYPSLIPRYIFFYRNVRQILLDMLIGYMSCYNTFNIISTAVFLNRGAVR